MVFLPASSFLRELYVNGQSQRIQLKNWFTWAGDLSPILGNGSHSELSSCPTQRGPLGISIHNCQEAGGRALQR